MVKSAFISMALAAATLGAAQQAQFQLLSSGAMKKVGGYVPQHLAVSPTAPTGLKNVPAIGGDSLYGSLAFGGTTYPVIVDIAAGVPKQILVDTIGAGNFANSKSFVFEAQGNGANVFYQGTAQLPSAAYHGKTLSVKFYRFATGTPRGDTYKSTLFYYSDYALTGTVKIGKTTYPALVADFTCSGEFIIPKTPTLAKQAPTLDLMIDRNGDGRFSGPSEEFDAASPFNIGGTTYEFRIGRPDGTHASLVKSSQTVAEIMPPPNTAVGQKILAFTTKDRDGKTVNFPADFKGKIVMLDFWATWCGPCMGEVPNVVKQYNTYHDKGFDILGISLDNAQTINNITKVTGEKGMTWDQVADGKYWDAEIAKLYGIQAIPAAFIVDGDTGMIIAEGEEIRGDALAPAIQKALAQRKGAPK